MLMQRMSTALRRIFGIDPPHTVTELPGRPVSDMHPALATPPTVPWRSPSAMRVPVHFDDSSRELIGRAQSVARAMGYGYVDPGLLLLASLHAGTPGARVLERMGVRADALGDAVASVMIVANPPKRRPVPPTDLPYTSRGKTVLERAIEDAEGCGDATVTAERVMLAAMRGIPHKRVVEVLRQQGVTPDAVAARLARPDARPH